MKKSLNFSISGNAHIYIHNQISFMLLIINHYAAMSTEHFGLASHCIPSLTYNLKICVLNYLILLERIARVEKQ